MRKHRLGGLTLAAAALIGLGSQAASAMADHSGNTTTHNLAGTNILNVADVIVPNGSAASAAPAAAVSNQFTVAAMSFITVSQFASSVESAITAQKAKAQAELVAQDEALQYARDYAPGSPGVWAELRQCESSGNYADDTGNGYYGAYQFLESTWLSLGYSGYPNQAPPAVQDEAARRLEARSGWGQWPVCSRRLGL